MGEDSRNHKMDKDVLGALTDAFNSEVSEELENKLEGRLYAFRQDLRENPYVRSQKNGRISSWRRAKEFFRPFLRPSLLAGLGIAFVAIVVFFPFGKSAPTWAEVVESFRMANSFYATFYIKDNTWSSISHIELWGGSKDRFRMLSGRNVIFGKKNEYLKTYDLTQRAEGYPDSTAHRILRAFDDIDESRVDILEAILESRTDGEIVDTTSLVHPDPVLSKDLVVFDAKSSRHNFAIRLWALRESRLPIRILYRGHAGWQTDVIITYTKAQPDKFFDPEAFATELKDPRVWEGKLMYLFMEDPAEGLVSTPET